jgi:RNA polymerase sigma-70 factor (ECF subfamily)
MTSTESTRTLDVDLADGDTGVPADVALDAFVVEHYDRLIRLARLICRDGPDAADAVQVALEQAWRRRSSLRQDGSLRPWLDRIVVREAIRIGRSRTSWLGRLFSVGSGVTWIELADASNEHQAAWSALRSEFADLPADQRAVVALHLYAGYSVAETADLVGAPLETVRSRLRLAKDRLRRQLGERES